MEHGEEKHTIYILSYGSEYIDDYDMDVGVFTDKERLCEAYRKLLAIREDEVARMGYSLIEQLKIYTFQRVNGLLEGDLFENKVSVSPRELGLPERRDIMLEKAIASKDYRSFIEEKHIEISDWNMATLIYNNYELPYHVKMDALKQLARDTKDKDLKKQIKGRLSYNMECMQAFKESVSNAYYRLDIYESGKYHEWGIYLSYETAYQDGLEEEEAFRITKECFTCKENAGENEGVFGMIDFSKGGQVIKAASFRKEGSGIDSGGKERFEERGVGLPLLFRCGDIVKVLGRDIYGIVIAPEDEEEHGKMQSLAAISDYSDFQVPVSYVFDGMEYQTIFAHGHISPAHLEFASLKDDDTRKGFLEYMSKTVQNKSLFSGSSRDADGREEPV